MALIAPFILLAFRFTNGEGGLQLRLSAHPYRLLELLEFKYIINVVDKERLWALVAGFVLIILFGVVVVKLSRKYSVHKYDGFLLALLPVALVYTFFPEDFMGRAIIISIRTQLFVFIIIACCIAYRLQDSVLKNVAGALVFFCFIILTWYRIDCRQDAAAALDDYLSAASYVRPGSVVLPLDFAPTGKNKKGDPIAGRNALFHHAAQYLATSKPLIALDNYEANMGYFPIRWKPTMNPYDHLSRQEGIEGLPPYAHIAEYEQQTGATVDYVLLWCYDPAFLANTHFEKLYAEINSLYTVEYMTPGGRTTLYRRKTN